jgi:hypothetical protein
LLTPARSATSLNVVARFRSIGSFYRITFIGKVTLLYISNDDMSTEVMKKMHEVVSDISNQVVSLANLVTNGSRTWFNNKFWGRCDNVKVENI